MRDRRMPGPSAGIPSEEMDSGLGTLDDMSGFKRPQWKPKHKKISLSYWLVPPVNIPVTIMKFLNLLMLH